MRRKVVSRIINLALKAQKMASSIGIPNLFQPGLVKEMIIADKIGHILIVSKRDADAHAPSNPEVKYEYLSCLEGGSGQLDRMFKTPPDKRQRSLSRITRNRKIYLAVFRKHAQLSLKIVYEIDPPVALAEAERQLDNSDNEISHIAFNLQWAARNGRIVYESDSVDVSI